MDSNGVSFRMFLIQLSFTTLGSESQISMGQVTFQSINAKSVWGACKLHSSRNLEKI